MLLPPAVPEAAVEALDLRRTTFDQLVAASHHPDRRLTPTMRDVPQRVAPV